MWDATPNPGKEEVQEVVHYGGCWFSVFVLNSNAAVVQVTRDIWTAV